MRVFSLAVCFTTCSLLIPSASSAQGLAEAAAKEKERRKGRSAKVFTEEDLRRAGYGRPREAATADAGSTPETPAAPKDGTVKEGAAKPKSDDEVRAEQEKAWRDRLTKANADAARLATLADSLQRGANDLTQNVYGGARAAQLDKLEDTKKQLAVAHGAIATLEAEGRRSGFRP